jgi:hypothetical protein
MDVEKEKNDEIKAYLNCHFIYPYEAVCWLLEFAIHSRNPPVEHPQVYYTDFPNKFVWDSK